MSGVVVWLTGLPRSGKSTLAERARAQLVELGRPVAVLDGDAVRAALVPRPGYDPAGRDAFYATLGGLADLLARQGLIVLVPATAHRRAYRDAARAKAPRFIEVHVDAPVDACAARPGGELYGGADRARVPGAGVEYEPPLSPEVVARGGADADAVAALVALASRAADAAA